MPHPPIVRPDLASSRCGAHPGMAPFLPPGGTRGAAGPIAAKRAGFVRPVGDRESHTPIWNGFPGGENPSTPASSSNMRFPTGDHGIIDDCSNTIPRHRQPLDRMFSVDQESSPAAIMHGKSMGVTVPRQQQPRQQWENRYLVEEDADLFAPLPCPDSPEGSPRSPEDSPRVHMERSVHDSIPGSAQSAMIARAFEVPSSEGEGATGPHSTSPDRPGSQAMLGRERLLQNAAAAPMRIAPPTHAHQEPLPMPSGLPGSQPQQVRAAPQTEQSMRRHSVPAGYGSEGSSSVPKPKRMMKKSVSFSELDTVAIDVVPYSEVYGDHPKNFHFDADGNKVLQPKPNYTPWNNDPYAVGMGDNNTPTHAPAPAPVEYKQSQVGGSYPRGMGFDRGYHEYQQESEPLFG